MLKNINFKTLIPHLVAIAIFITITFAYLTPLLNGKQIRQSDARNAFGMARDARTYNDTHNNDETFWSNAMFGGMPTYQSTAKESYANVCTLIIKGMYLNLPHPASLVFLLLFGFYILLCALRVNKWLCIVGAIAFAFSSYFFIIIEVGHNTKTLAIALLPPTFAGLYLMFNRKLMLGFVCFMFFLSLQIYANHFQISYYFVLFCIIYGAFEVFNFIKEKAFNYLFKVFGLISLAALIAVGLNSKNIIVTAAYTPYTTRGATEQISEASNTTSGLDKDYATGWSYGKAETMSLMIPAFKGFSTSLPIGDNKDALKEVNPQFAQNIAQIPQYWGDQPGTTDTYAGAIMVFLFVLGLLIIEGTLKWSLLFSTIFFMMLAWGKNFMGLTDFMLDYFPGYNKFRAVSTCMIIVELTIPLLGILAIDKFLKQKDFFKSSINFSLIKKQISVEKLFYIAFGLTGGLCLVYYFLPSLTDFFATGEYENIQNQIGKQNGPEIARTFLDNLEAARIVIFKADALRSFMFITVAAGLIYLYVKKIVKNELILIVFLGILILVDMWPINKKSLNDTLFVSKSANKLAFEEKPANTFILNDKDPNFRVLNVAVSTFNDASTSYYHKSIGGYHGAKLKRYQELIETRLSENIQDLMGGMQGSNSDSAIKKVFEKQQVLNMLNTKYVIYNPEAAPIQNNTSYGNAWFVNSIKQVTSANEALEAMKSFNARETAVIEQKHFDAIKDFKAGARASLDKIILTGYEPNKLSYKSSANEQGLAVFSEIYYNDGWNAYIDDKLVPHTRANYVLRALIIPAGEHKIDFKFEPMYSKKGNTIAGVSSLIFILSIVGGLYFHFKANTKSNLN